MDNKKEPTRAVIKRKQVDQPAIPQRTNHLLVIGIDQYEDTNITNLHNAVRDAKNFKDLVLTTYQFEEENVISLFNKKATRSRILTTFSDLLNSLSEQDNLVFYYSGHGELVQQGRNKRGFWVPTDAQINDYSSYLPNNEITNLFQNSYAHHIVGIVDSCFSGSLFLVNRGNSVEERLTSAPSRWLLTAGRLELVSDGSLGKNSPFATALLTHLKTNQENSLWLADLINRVLKSVQFNSEKQTPRGEPLQNTGHHGGQFIFYKKGYVPTTNDHKEDKIAASRGIDKEEELDASDRGSAIPAMRGGISEAIIEEANTDYPASESAPQESTTKSSTSIQDSENVIAGSTINAGGDVYIGHQGSTKDSTENFDLGPGKLLYAIPTTMQVQEVSTCKIRIAKNRKLLLEDLQTTSKLIIKDLRKITKVIGVELVDISGGTNFNVLLGSTEEQYIDQKEYTEWTFFVTPLRPGKHQLQLKISTILILNNKERKKNLSFLKAVLVNTEPAVISNTNTIPSITSTLKQLPTTLTALKDHLKALIESDLELALTTFKSILSKDNTRSINDITLQLGSYNRTKKDHHRGLSTVSQRDRTFARIRYALTQMIDDLEEQDVTLPAAETSKMEYQNSKGEQILLDLELLEQKGLKDRATTLIELVNRLQETLDLEDDPMRSLKYEKQLEKAERQLNDIKRQLD